MSAIEVHFPWEELKEAPYGYLNRQQVEIAIAKFIILSLWNCYKNYCNNQIVLRRVKCIDTNCVAMATITFHNGRHIAIFQFIMLTNSVTQTSLLYTSSLWRNF